MACTGQSANWHILVGIFQLDNQSLVEETLLLVGDILVNLGDIPPDTSNVAVHAGIWVGIPS